MNKKIVIATILTGLSIGLTATVVSKPMDKPSEFIAIPEQATETIPEPIAEPVAEPVEPAKEIIKIAQPVKVELAAEPIAEPVIDHRTTNGYAKGNELWRATEKRLSYGKFAIMTGSIGSLHGAALSNGIVVDEIPEVGATVIADYNHSTSCLMTVIALTDTEITLIDHRSDPENERVIVHPRGTMLPRFCFYYIH